MARAFGHRRAPGSYIHAQYGGGVLALRNLDDQSKYQSAPIPPSGLTNDQESPNGRFTFAARCAGPGIDDVRFVAATNPEANWCRNTGLKVSCRKNSPTPKTISLFVPALPGTIHICRNRTGRCWIHCPAHCGRRAVWRLVRAAVEGLVYANFAPDNVTLREPDGVRPVRLRLTTATLIRGQHCSCRN